MQRNSLNALNINVRAYFDYQKERLAMDGRLGQKKDGTKKKKAPPRDESLLVYLKSRREEVHAFESGLEKEIAVQVKEHPLWPAFLKDVKGCGPIIAAVIVSEFDIYKAPMVSNLVSFAGLAPGKDRKMKGKKRPYNQFLKDKLCGVLGSSFLKCQSPYCQIYYDEKFRLENSDVLVEERIGNGKTKMVKWRDAKLIHRHQAAVRRMIKRFLQDLYVAWRDLEDLPIREPYAEEYLGKKHSA